MTDHTDPRWTPDDEDRTVVMPNPGGRRAPLPPGPPPRHPPPPPERERQIEQRTPDERRHQIAEPVGSPGSGVNPLVDAAVPLLAPVAALCTGYAPADPIDLRARILSQMRSFAADTRGARASAETMKAASYCLCTVIDEAVLRTPWGASSDWRKLSVLSEIHGDAWGGDKFFDILRARMADPAPNIDLLELLYICLALGFQGKYAMLDDGQRSLDRTAQDLYDLILRQRGEIHHDLSPHWRNEEAARVALEHPVPLWVVGAITGAVLLTLYIGFRFFLADLSSPAIDRLAALGHDQPSPTFAVPAPKSEIQPTATRPPEPIIEPLAPTFDLGGEVSAFLQPEIDEGLVTVLDSPTHTTIRITGTALFPPGSDKLAPSYTATFHRIRTAIAGYQDKIGGDIIVVGHTDNLPLKRSLRFQNNYDLSMARATAVAAILADDKRVTSKIERDGKGASEPLGGGDPVAGNDTQDKRDRNRRVEILIEK